MKPFSGEKKYMVLSLLIGLMLPVPAMAADAMPGGNAPDLYSAGVKMFPACLF